MISSFDFSGPSTRFNGKILFTTSVLVLVVLFLLKRLAVVLLDRLSGVISLVELVVAKLCLGAMTFCV
jgi:hypothetical protein